MVCRVDLEFQPPGQARASGPSMGGVMMGTETRRAGPGPDHSVLPPAYGAEGISPVFPQRRLRVTQMSSEVGAVLGLPLVLSSKTKWQNGSQDQCWRLTAWFWILLFHLLVPSIWMSHLNLLWTSISSSVQTGVVIAPTSLDGCQNYVK